VVHQGQRLCDADLDDDCNINFIDLGRMKSVFFSADADADLYGSGRVNVLDLGILKGGFFRPRGPSGVPNLCDEPLIPRERADSRSSR
jgi:hypothetical protein